MSCLPNLTPLFGPPPPQGRIHPGTDRGPYATGVVYTPVSAAGEPGPRGSTRRGVGGAEVPVGESAERRRVGRKEHGQQWTVSDPQKTMRRLGEPVDSLGHWIREIREWFING